MAFRVPLNERTPEHAKHIAALQQHQIERQLRNVARSKADDEETSFPGDRAHRRLGVGTADRIINHIGAAPIGTSPQGFLEIAAGVIDRCISAVLAREGQLFIRRGAGDYARAHDFSKLDGSKADTSGGAEHRQRFAWFEFGTILECMKGRAICNADARGAVEIERVWNFDQSVGTDDNPFARRAVSHVAQYPVAGLESGDFRTQAFDGAGEFGGRRKWRGKAGTVYTGAE